MPTVRSETVRGKKQGENTPLCVMTRTRSRRSARPHDFWRTMVVTGKENSGALMEPMSGRRAVSNVEAMATLSEYLELALDKGGHLVMVRSQSGTSVLYVGDISLPEDELKKCGVIQNELADAILESTRSGFNELTLNDGAYRFMRTFANVGSKGAVVFASV
jgi:hypothetical protein